MKKYPAIAIVEFRDIAVGIHATDAMLKKSPISLLKCGIISRGRYLTLIGGSTAAVDESFREGLFGGGESVLDSVILPDVHPQVHDAVLGHRAAGGAGALAILETPTVSCNVRAAEMAVKGTPVSLVEMQLADSSLDGKGVSIYHGELPDIEAAMAIAASLLEREGVRATRKIIPAPHDALGHEMATGAYFRDAALSDLDGEKES